MAGVADGSTFDETCMLQSCLYQGEVWHRRRGAVEHRFRYRLWMAYLDLEELPELVGQGRLLSDRKFSSAAFLRGDHVGDSAEPLAETVRNLVEQETGRRPAGPIRLLTLLRQWGYYFSPLNLFYCFDAAGTGVESVVAEVSNTPWRERHCYVLWEGNRQPGPTPARAAEEAGSAGSHAGNGGVVASAADSGVSVAAYVHPKAFHVSPFMGMEAEYRWQLSVPGPRLNVSIASVVQGEELFQAGMSLRAHPLDRQNLRRMMLANPAMSATVMAAIYFQAARLWIKRAPFFPHPNQAAPASG